MATVSKDFKVKSGLIVEGTTGKINNFDILTKKQADQDYIVGLIGGTATPINTPDTVVKRDSSGNFAAGTITAALTGNVTGNLTGDVTGDVTGDLTGDVTGNVTGNLTGNVTGNLTGDVTGNADTATALETPRTIAGQTFDGTQNVEIAPTDLTGVTATASELNILDGATVTTTELNYLDGVTSAVQTQLNDLADEIDDIVSNTALAEHIEATSGVHGVTGDVVGTTDTQTLTNKTLGSGTNLSVNLDMNGNKIEDLGTPTAGTDATTKNYVDGADTATLGSANSYTDDEITALDTSLKAYADQAESDAISSAASAAAALYAPLAGATFTGEVLLSGDPTQALGAATKQYVDAVAEGLHIHASVVAATTANVDLATGGLLTIDDVTLNADERVLVKNQSNATQNGIYLAKAGAWVRAEDYDTAEEIQAGDFVFVSGGTLYNSTGWVQENPVTTLGTDAIVWDQFSGAGEYTAGTGLTLTGTSFAIDETYTATKSYVDGEITDLDTAAQGYADTAEENANDYTNTREAAITTAYENYADQAEADAKIYTDEEIAALDSDDIEEGGTNLYFTDERAIAAVGGSATSANEANTVVKRDAFGNFAAGEITASLEGNVTGDVTGTVSDISNHNTDGLTEGALNKYFTETRARDSFSAGTAIDYNSASGVIAVDASQLNTGDIAEGSNQYYTDSRVRDVLTGSTQTNISITEVDGDLIITAENGVADSTTADLEEDPAGSGTSGTWYFTNDRAVAALEAVVPNFTEIDINEVATQVAAQVEVATASQAVAYSFPSTGAGSYRSAKFLVKVAYGTHTEVSEVLLTLDTSDNIALTEYAIVGTNGSASAITAGMNGTNVELLVATTNNNSTVTVMGTLLV